ncbi:MAG: molybdenum ABC transporter ATP-binding protein [Hyphomonadaceae bacterium]
MSRDLEAALAVRRGAFRLDAAFTAPGDGITALFGPSGAGKSLLLGALAGFERLESGRVVFDGRVLDDVGLGRRTPPHLREIGIVFQDARLFPHLSVRGNLRYAEARAPQGGGALALEEAAERFDLTALLDRRPRNLSGGEKARVALARAVLARPRLLLLDEPFAALDGVRRRVFVKALRALHEALRIPMIVVTHQIEDVAALADHVVALRAGAVVAAGPLAAATATEAFQALLDARDSGAAAVLRAGEGAAWVRADQVLLAASAPTGLSARHVWPARIASLAQEADGAMLAVLETEAGQALRARVTAEAAAELALAPGRPAWAIVKAHAI